MTVMVESSDVCAIAVTYHPDSEFPARIERVLRQVGALVIVDNGSTAAETQMLHTCAEHPAVTLVLNRANLGVAAALNIGIEHAVAGGYSWVLLLDQDSTVDDDMVQELLATQAAFPHRGKLAVIGAGFADVNKTSPPADQAAHAEPWEEVKQVITSGSLLPLASHAAVGPFRDEFFIDYVDLDYCLRARAQGFHDIKTRKPLMSHAIGAYSQHRWLWKKKWTTNHSPDRRYYIARNDTVMLREYGGYAYGTWALKSLQRSYRLCKRIVFYESNKTAKIIAVAQGWWDGIRGRLGPRRP